MEKIQIWQEFWVNFLGKNEANRWRDWERARRLWKWVPGKSNFKLVHPNLSSTSQGKICTDLNTHMNMLDIQVFSPNEFINEHNKNNKHLIHWHTQYTPRTHRPKWHTKYCSLDIFSSIYITYIVIIIVVRHCCGFDVYSTGVRIYTTFRKFKSLKTG